MVVELLRVRSRERDGVVCVVMPEVYRVIQIGSKSWVEPDEVITCIKEVLAYTGILELPLSGKSSSDIQL